jgi:hypothetical protein
MLKTFKVKETKVIETLKEFEVLEPGNLYRIKKAYNNFKVGEIILIHGSHYNQHYNYLAHRVCWWFKDGDYNSGKLQVVERDVTITIENLEKIKLDTLARYIKEELS